MFRPFVIGLLAAAGLASVAPAADNAGLRLACEVDGTSLPLGSVTSDRYWLIDGLRYREAPVEAAWRIEGDLREHHDLVCWTPMVWVEQQLAPDGTDDGEGTWMRARMVVQHWTGEPGKSPHDVRHLETDWPDLPSGGVVFVFGWYLDGRITRVKLRALSADDRAGGFVYYASFRLSAEETRGFPVALLWTERGFVRPAPAFDQPAEQELFVAVTTNDMGAVRAAAAAGQPWRILGRAGGTYLHFAAVAGATDVMAFLLTQDPALANLPAYREGPPALSWAVALGRTECVRLLLAAGARADALSETTRSPLRIAVSHGHRDIVRLLLAAGARDGLDDTSGQAPFYAALRDGYGGIAADLAAAGANQQLLQSEAGGYLVERAGDGATSATRWLLDRGTPIDVRDRGLTALQKAACRAPAAMAELLLDRGARLDEPDPQGQTPLMLAVRAGNDAFTAALLGRGADVHARSPDGATPLHLAAQSNAVAIIPLLLHHGATLTARTDDGRTPLDAAILSGAADASRLLATLEALPTLDAPWSDAVIQGMVTLDLAEVLAPMLGTGWNADSELASGWTLADAVDACGATRCAELLARNHRTAGENRAREDGNMPAAAGPASPLVPEDPRYAWTHLDEAVLQVEAIVDTTGQVILPRVRDPADSMLVAAALATVRATTFEPALVDGAPQASRVSVPVIFPETGQRAWELWQVDYPPQITRSDPLPAALARPRDPDGNMVTCRVTIDATGRARSVTVFGSLAPATRTDLTTWWQTVEFVPARRSGRNVAVTFAEAYSIPSTAASRMLPALGAGEPLAIGLSPLWTRCGVAPISQDGLRLVGTTGDRRIDPVEVAADAILAETVPGELSPVNAGTTWQVLGDLRRHAAWAVWSNLYDIRRQPAAAPDDPPVYEVRQALLLAGPRDRKEATRVGPITTWTDNPQHPVAAVAFWWHDHTAHQVQVVPIAPPAPEERRDYTAVFQITADQLDGIPVILLWANGRFIAPPADRGFASANRAVAAALDGDLAGFARELDQDVFTWQAYRLATILAHTDSVEALDRLLQHRDRMGSDVNEWLELLPVAAARAGRIATLRYLLKTGADINALVSHGTPLHVATENGHTETVRFLLRTGAAMDTYDFIRRLPIEIAAQSGPPDVLDALLEAGSPPGRLWEYASAHLDHAAQRGDRALVAWYLRHGVSTAAMPYGHPPLVTTAMAGHVDVARELVAAGADLEATGSDGRTPLMTAAAYGRAPMVAFLLEAGARTESVDRQGRTAFHLAAQANSAAAVEVLVRHAGSAAFVTPARESPLASALEAGALDAARVLMRAGETLEASDPETSHALVGAISVDFAEVVEAALQDGWSPHHALSDGVFALDLALARGASRCAELLRSAGAIEHRPISPFDPAAEDGRFRPPHPPPDPRPLVAQVPTATVRVGAIVAGDGQLIAPWIVRSDDPLLNATTLESAREWRLPPASGADTGRPRMVEFDVTYPGGAARTFQAWQVDREPRLRAPLPGARLLPGREAGTAPRARLVIASDGAAKFAAVRGLPEAVARAWEERLRTATFAPAIFVGRYVAVQIDRTLEVIPERQP